MKKLLLLTCIFIFSYTAFFAQEAQESQIDTVTPQDEKDYVDNQNMSVTEVEELIQSQSFIHKIDFVFGIEPMVSINTHTKDSDGKFISAPSPMYIPVYIGLSIPNYTAISFQPTLRFFTSYYLVYQDMVLPAEIENRTGQTFNFLLNLPVVFKLNYKDKVSWSIFAGVAGLFRFATAPINIKETEPGFTGTVKSDVGYMNKWFYKNVRFLFLSTGIDWMFYYGTTKFGPEFSIFFPISAIMDKSVDGLLIGAGIKVEF
jgi:hypothetical protein